MARPSQSYLPQLRKINALRRLGVQRFRIDRINIPLTQVPTDHELLPAVYAPFQSVEEVLIWERIQTYDAYWQAHIDLFGGVGVPGGTNLDFYNAKLKIALYADGPPHLLPSAIARDIVLRKEVENAGLRVLAFTYRLPTEVIRNFPAWYAQEIGN